MGLGGAAETNCKYLGGAIVIPPARLRYAGQAAGVVFESVCMNALVNGAPQANIDTSAGSCLIARVYGNNTAATLTVDGVAAEQLDATNKWLWGWANLTAGTHVIKYDGGGIWESFVAASYTGVKGNGVANYATAATNTPTITPTGTGDLYIGGFGGADASTMTASGLAVVRGQILSPSSNVYSAALADSVNSPVVLSAASSASWNAQGIWLSGSVPKVTYDNSWSNSGATTNLDTAISVGAGSKCCVVLSGVSDDITQLTACTLDGASGTFKTYGNGIIVVWTNISPGNHTIRMTSTNYKACSIASYFNVGSISTITGANYAITSATMPCKMQDLVISAFQWGGTTAATAGANSLIRKNIAYSSAGSCNITENSVKKMASAVNTISGPTAVTVYSGSVQLIAG